MKCICYKTNCWGTPSTAFFFLKDARRLSLWRISLQILCPQFVRHSIHPECLNFCGVWYRRSCGSKYYIMLPSLPCPFYLLLVQETNLVGQSCPKPCFSNIISLLASWWLTILRRRNLPNSGYETYRSIAATVVSVSSFMRWYDCRRRLVRGKPRFIELSIRKLD